MKTLNQPLFVAVVLATVMTAGATAAPAPKTRDMCIAAPTGGGGFNMFVFRDVDPLAAGRAVLLRGLYFVTGSARVAPLHGSAIMASDGTVRLGVFVHSTAESTNDFTLSGVTDATFAGTLKYDSDGDFAPNGTLTASPVDCASLSIP